MHQDSICEVVNALIVLYRLDLKNVNLFTNIADMDTLIYCVCNMYILMDIAGNTL